MKKIRVSLGRDSYWIYIGQGILNRLGHLLKRCDVGNRLAVITNPPVNRRYGELVTGCLGAAGFETITIEIPDGEKYKTLDMARRIYDKLIYHQLDRRSGIIALGGGVIGDLAGFVAATYMRGVNYIQVPTSLLAQVDSSVGGKVALNHPQGKNLIGTFYQPRLVVTDLATLKTLPPRELNAGLAEVVKYGMIADHQFFKYLEKSVGHVKKLDMQVLERVISRSCQIKATIVERDERDRDERIILNYGHTVGHAIETLTDYRRYRHGEAVAIGMHSEARLSHQLGVLSGRVVARQAKLLHTIGLPIQAESVDPQDIVQILRLDKKVVDGRVRFVLPKSIGEVFVADGVSDDLLYQVLSGQVEGG